MNTSVAQTVPQHEQPRWDMTLHEINELARREGVSWRDKLVELGFLTDADTEPAEQAASTCTAADIIRKAAASAAKGSPEPTLRRHADVDDELRGLDG